MNLLPGPRGYFDGSGSGRMETPVHHFTAHHNSRWRKSMLLLLLLMMLPMSLYYHNAHAIICQTLLSSFEGGMWDGNVLPAASVFPFLIVSMYSNLYTTVIRIRKGHSCGAEGGTIAFFAERNYTNDENNAFEKLSRVWEKQKVSIKNKTAFNMSNLINFRQKIFLQNISQNSKQTKERYVH